jgi:AbrB family looped-hinge helix DNA binding protein
MPVARVTSKGQVTIPKSVREALDIAPGDNLHFDVEGDRAAIAKRPSFIDMAGSIEVPEDVRGLSWEEIRQRAHRAWAFESEARWRRSRQESDD